MHGVTVQLLPAAPEAALAHNDLLVQPKSELFLLKSVRYMFNLD